MLVPEMARGRNEVSDVEQGEGQCKRLISLFVVSGSKNGLNGHVHNNHHIHSNHHVTHHHSNHSHHNHHSWCYAAPCPVASPSSSSSLPAGNHSNRPTDPFSQSLFSPRQQQQQLQLPGNHWQQHDHGCYDSYRDDNDQYRAQRPGTVVTGRCYDNRPRRVESSNQRWRAESPRSSDVERGGANRNQFNINFRSGSTYQRRERCNNPPPGPQRDRYSNNPTVPPASSYRCRSAPPGGGYMSQAHFSNNSLQQQPVSFSNSASTTTATAAFHQQGAAAVAVAHRHRSASNHRLSAPVYSSQSGWPTVTSLAGGGSSSSSRRHGNSYHHRSDSNDYEPCWWLCARYPVTMVKRVVSAFCALMGFTKIN